MKAQSLCWQPAGTGFMQPAIAFAGATLRWHAAYLLALLCKRWRFAFAISSAAQRSANLFSRLTVNSTGWFWEEDL